MKEFAFTLIVVTSCMHLSHLSMLGNRPTASLSLEETLPSLDAIKLISLNYETLASDYYWLRTLSHFGTKAGHKAEYPMLSPLLERVLHLDPYFEIGYFFAGTAITSAGADSVDESIRLMKPGLEHLPDYVYIPVLLGFNHYYYKRDFEEATRYFALAATKPGCPANVIGLATKLSAEISTPEVGIQIIDTILEKVTDDKLRKTYLERRHLLQLEVALKTLQGYVKKYALVKGSPPTHISDLVQPGFLRSVPQQDPIGGNYYIDKEGNAATTSEDKRLRLSESVLKNLRKQ